MKSIKKASLEWNKLILFMLLAVTLLVVFLMASNFSSFSISNIKGISSEADNIRCDIGGPCIEEDLYLKIQEVANNLDIDPDHLYTVIYFETGGTFDPCQKNQAGSRATGLIQFMPSTAEELGTSTDELCEMSAVEQMNYVEKYFELRINQYGDLDTLDKVYLAVFTPTAIEKENDEIIYQVPQLEYEQNEGLDTSGDGSITRGEIIAKITEEHTKLAENNQDLSSRLS